MRPQPASRSYLSATFCVAFLGSVLSLYPLIGLGSNYLLQAVQHNMFLAAVALAGSLAASLASGRTAYGITAASRVMIILLVPGSIAFLLLAIPDVLMTPIWRGQVRDRLYFLARSLILTAATLGVGQLVLKIMPLATPTYVVSALFIASVLVSSFALDVLLGVMELWTAGRIGSRFRRGLHRLARALPDPIPYAVGLLGAALWHTEPLALLPLIPVILALVSARTRADRAQARAWALGQVLASTKEMRLHRRPEDLLASVASAARALTGATAVSAYYLKHPADSALRRITTSTRRISRGGDAVLTLSAGRGEIRASGTRDVPDLLIPIAYNDNEPLAALVAFAPPLPLSSEVHDALTILSTHAGVALHNAKMHHLALLQAQEDTVTGLPNYRAFTQRLTAAINRVCRQGGAAAILLIDIDNFGAINTACGYEAADQALVAMAQALRKHIGKHGFLARTGSDEFAMIVDLDTTTRVRAFGSELQRAIGSVVVTGRDSNVRATAAIGAAIAPEHGTTSMHLLHAATRALDAARAAGLGILAFPEEATDSIHGDPLLLASQLATSHLATLEALAATVDAKDHYTHGHSRRVASYAASLAEAMCLPVGTISRVRRAGDLHDIGKIGIPDAVLVKKGPLSDDERATLQEHAVIGERVLSAVPFLRDILPAVRHHHERWDGRGYPDGIAGQTIPVEATILAVVDAFDAMTTTRTYRQAIDLNEACRRLREASASQFEPRAVAVFEEALKSGRIRMLKAEKVTLPPERIALRRRQVAGADKPKAVNVTIRQHMRDVIKIAAGR